MYFRQPLNDETACASCLLGCNFVAALTRDMPPTPEHQAEIVAINRAGRAPARQA